MLRWQKRLWVEVRLMGTKRSNIQQTGEKRRSIAERLPFLPVLVALLIRLIHRSCRISCVGKRVGRADVGCGAAGPRIASFWHCSFPAVAYYFRDMGIMTIISESRDGDLAAGVVKELGYIPFRGSPGKGGAGAVKRLISAFRSSPLAGFVADGSQGPARIAQKGILSLAAHSGYPILPVGMAAHPCWRLKTWDRTILAKPFAKVVYAFGPFIHIERGASPESMERHRVELEECLNSLMETAEREARGGRVA